MNDERTIAAFDAVCRRLAGFSERICTEWADGYLSALRAGPRALLITEWLEPMCGDAFERVFADPDDVQQAIDALVGRCNAIGRELDPERLLDDESALHLRPVLFEPDETDASALPPTGSRWSEGFLAALGDFEADWRLPERASADARADHEAALRRIAVLTLDAPALQAHLAEMYPGQTLGRDDLVDEACFAVQDLRLWWLDHAPRPATLRVPKAPGRNDACPCGSGKKWKKCCGSNA